MALGRETNFGPSNPTPTAKKRKATSQPSITTPIDKKSKSAMKFGSFRGDKGKQDHKLNDEHHRENVSEKLSPQSTARMSQPTASHPVRSPVATSSSRELKEASVKVTIKEESPDENSDDSDSSISSGYRRAADIKRTVFESDPKKQVLRTISGNRGSSYTNRAPRSVKTEK